MTMASEASARAEIHHSGEAITIAHPGSFYCVACGYAVSAETPGPLPECPACGGESFRRGSIFDRRPAPKTSAVDSAAAEEWIEEVRAELEQAGVYLAFDDGEGEYAAIRLEPGWTRIGRSLSQDLRIHPSKSWPLVRRVFSS